jgi:activator of 2-hydroxyglutaryl-CoA dehydratase
MVHALETVLGRKMQISPDAHYMGAVGAAIFALEKMDDTFENTVWREHAAGSRN